jgi:Ca2+-transporting ATPase
VKLEAGTGRHTPAAGVDDGRRRGAGPAVPPSPWASAAEEVLAALAVDPRRGLAEAEVRARRAACGPNRLRQVVRRSASAMLRDQLASLLVALLAVASAAAFALGEPIDGLAIASVIVLNAAIGFATERRAVRSMEALRQLGRVSATVRRGGRVRRVPAEELVPGDVVLCEGGDVLTADLRLFEASKLEADESALTGESLPVAKRSEPAAKEAALGERACMLFKGTALTRGSGEGVVVATGMATELGRISALVAEAEPETTPIEKRLEVLGRRLIGLTLAVVAGVAVAGLLGGRDLLLMIEVAVALAVASVPEGLPIVATVALARGMWRMARQHALIERLGAVETLGSTTLILTDKTGTLTENRMTVVQVRTAGGAFDVSGAGLALAGGFARDRVPQDPRLEPVLMEALRIAALCNNASLHEAADGSVEAVGDPTEVALLVAARKAGLDRAELLACASELREIAFDPDLKLMATLHEDGGVLAAVKGAPEAVVERATRVRTAAGDAPLDDAGRAAWLARAHEMAGRGERVLAVATRALASAGEPPYAELTLLALLGLLDPPRARVSEALSACRAAGVRVVMVTGDHLATASTVARAVGLLDEGPPPAGACLDARSWPELSKLGEPEARALLDASVIARASPKQKLDLIALHQQRGAVVAMTGDGVNDAPALKKADIGIAMGRRGTQVAKEAAAMVLQDDAFETIVSAVAQGRAIFGNIRKFCIYLLSCNVSEILAVGAATLAQGPLPILPLQILFLNLVTDVFPARARAARPSCESRRATRRSPCSRARTGGRSAASAPPSRSPCWPPSGSPSRAAWSGSARRRSPSSPWPWRSSGTCSACATRARTGCATRSRAIPGCGVRSRCARASCSPRSTCPRWRRSSRSRAPGPRAGRSRSARAPCRSPRGRSPSPSAAAAASRAQDAAASSEASSPGARTRGTGRLSRSRRRRPSREAGSSMEAARSRARAPRPPAGSGSVQKSTSRGAASGTCAA